LRRDAAAGLSVLQWLRRRAGHRPDNADTRTQPSDYTPKHLADKILQSKSALEGERKQVTILFADVKGSMNLAEKLGAEGWHAVLDRCGSSKYFGQASLFAKRRFWVSA
jgi:class 3 adenylate cyclase